MFNNEVKTQQLSISGSLTLAGGWGTGKDAYATSTHHRHIRPIHPILEWQQLALTF